MSLDKKARGTTLRLVGLTGQGAPRIVDDAPEDVLASAYAELTRV
jgi:3-dehydroquinate synthetase